MFNPERLLGHLLKAGMSGAFGGRRKRRSSSGGLGSLAGALGGSLGGAAKAQLGMGALGVAIAAFEHFTKDRASMTIRPDGIAPPKFPPSGAESVPSVVADSTKTVAVSRQSAGFGVGRDTSVPRVSPPPPPEPDPKYADVVVLVRAMIAAAAADGLIDEVERANILKHVDDAGLDNDTRAFLEAELSHPRSMAAIVASSRPEIAKDVYAASCIAITRDTDAEKAYLDTLASRLGLDVATRSEIDAKFFSDPSNA